LIHKEKKMDDEYIDDEVQPEYASSPAFSGDQMHSDDHVTTDDLYGVTTKIFSISTPEGATLEQLAANSKNGLFWEMPAELKTLLKQVNKSSNRSNVSEKDLEGDLGKALFLSAKVISYHSDCPKRLAVDIPGLVPTVYTSSGRHNWVIPANCQNTVIGQSIFDPDNKFTRFMYEHNQKCNLKTLERHIRFDIDHNNQVAGMDSKGIGWKVLTDNLMRADSPYIDAMEGIYAKNRHIFDNPDSPFSQIAQVPMAIAREIFDEIAAPLKKIEKAYTDFNTWKVRFRPADMKAWNATEGLAKDAVVYGSDHVGLEVEAKLNTPFSAGIDLEISYILSE
jgi:hypothetical protein